MPSLEVVPQGPSTYHAMYIIMGTLLFSGLALHTLLFVGYAIKMNYSQLATAMLGPLLFSSEIQWQFHS
jgi:hypothetical protein